MTFAVSVGAALVVEALVDGADGADATEGSALGAGAEAVEVGAACVFNSARLSELVVGELGVVAVTLAAGEVERGAEATLERLELELVLGEALGEVFAILAGSAGALGAGTLLRLGAGMAGAVSVTLAELSVEEVEASVAAVAGGAVSVLLAVCVAGSGALTTLSLRL